MKEHCAAKILLAVWQTFLHENNYNRNSNKLIYNFVFIPFLFFFVETIVPPPNRLYNMRDTGIYDPALIQENTGQWKPVFWHILYSVWSRLVPTVIPFRRPNIFSYLHNFQVSQEKYNLQHRCKKRLRFIKWIITESE